MRVMHIIAAHTYLLKGCLMTKYRMGWGWDSGHEEIWTKGSKFETKDINHVSLVHAAAYGGRRGSQPARCCRQGNSGRPPLRFFSFPANATLGPPFPGPANPARPA